MDIKNAAGGTDLVLTFKDASGILFEHYKNEPRFFSLDHFGTKSETNWPMS